MLLYHDSNARRDEEKLKLIKQRVRAATQHAQKENVLLRSVVISDDGKKTVRVWNMPSLQSDDSEVPVAKVMG